MTPKQSPLFALIAAMVLASPAHATPGSASDFRLPEGTPSPTPAPQGPVAPDVPESQVPPPASKPTAATPSPMPSPRAAPSAVPIRLPQTRAAPTATPVARALPSAPVNVVPVPAAAPTLAPAPALQAPLPTAPITSPTEAAGRSQGSGFALGPTLAALLGGLVLVVVLGAFGWMRRARSRPAGHVAAPVVDRPQPVEPPAPEAPAPPTPAPPPPAAPAPLPPEGVLTMNLLPVQMSMTLVNAALSWKLEVANRGGTALDGVEVAFDMISAHKELGVEERTSGPRDDAEVRKLGQIQPGGVRVLDGVVRLPFPAIVPIWHGDLALLMPLVRLRVSAAGAMPITRVILVGQPSPRDPATLQPFRLDLGPRVYPDLARRIFA